MFLKKTEHRRLNPYVTMAVGALALVGAVSIVKYTKNMMLSGCDKMSCALRDMTGKESAEMCEP